MQEPFATPNIMPGSGRCENQVAAALARIGEIVTDGLQHGYFKTRIECTITSGGKRALVIEAGKIHRFVIPESDLQQ